MLISCSGQTDNGSITKKELKITADKKFVQAFGGDYVTLTVTLGDEVKTEGVTFYDQDWNMIDVEGFKFMTDKPGDHRINAEYGTYSTKTPVKVTALAVAIPENPQDSAPQSVDFVAKSLLVQFTTTGCTYCPMMKKRIKDVLDETYAPMVVKVDCHNGIVNNVNDPAYVYIPNFGGSGMPHVMIDYFYEGGNNVMSEDKMKESIESMIAYKGDLAAGISVASALADDQIVTKVVVKPAVTGEYNVGIMLLEDNIVANASQQQQGNGVEDWMNTHNSCIRYMEAGSKYEGLSMGVINAGEVSDHVFVFNLTDIWAQGRRNASQVASTWSQKWVEDELHFAVFVTTVGEDAKGREFLYVSNVIDCPVDGVTPFQYK